MHSELGDIPCPFFGSTCNCAALPQENLLRALVSKKENGKETLEKYHESLKQLGAIQEAEREGARRVVEENESKRREVDTMQGKVAQLINCIESTFLRGQTVPCPWCGDGCSKDDACMHVKHCDKNWCFCCGRPSGNEAGECQRGSDGRGCDSISLLIERNPGWGQFHYGLETAGEGALQEFLRRQIMFFLRDLKERTDENVWEQMQFENKNKLQNVVGGNRSILWEEIDDAEYPLFGNNKEVVLTTKRRDLLEGRARRVALQAHSQAVTTLIRLQDLLVPTLINMGFEQDLVEKMMEMDIRAIINLDWTNDRNIEELVAVMLTLQEDARAKSQEENDRAAEEETNSAEETQGRRVGVANNPIIL